MSDQELQKDAPINLEESSTFELKRAVVADEDPSSSTIAPVWVPKPHARNESRELLRQKFDAQ